MQTMKIPRVTMALFSTSVIKQGWMAYSDKRSSETYNVVKILSRKTKTNIQNVFTKE